MIYIKLTPNEQRYKIDAHSHIPYWYTDAFSQSHPPSYIAFTSFIEAHEYLNKIKRRGVRQ